jgi:hypothetical protein
VALRAGMGGQASTANKRKFDVIIAWTIEPAWEVAYAASAAAPFSAFKQKMKGPFVGVAARTTLGSSRAPPLPAALVRRDRAFSAANSYYPPQ